MSFNNRSLLKKNLSGRRCSFEAIQFSLWLETCSAARGRPGCCLTLMEAAADNEPPRACSRTDRAAQHVKMKQFAFLCRIYEKKIVSTATSQLLLLLLANRHAKLASIDICYCGKRSIFVSVTTMGGRMIQLEGETGRSVKSEPC